MAEFRCGKCGWKAKALYVEGILAASKDHQEAGCTEGES